MADNSLALEWDVTREEGFVTVFRAHRDYVYRLACLLLGQAQDAEDVTQEVFLRLYKSLPSFQPERASLRTWLTRVVVNTCHTHRRRNTFQRLWQRLPMHGEEDEGQAWPALEVSDPSPWGAPEDRALHAELRQTLRTVLMRLRPEHRAVVVLHYYFEFSCPEIARTLACPEGTVYSRLHYARRVLQTQLERNGHGLEGVLK